MKEVIEIIAITGVVIASAVQSYFSYRTIMEMKILDKSKDIFDFKKVIEKPAKEPKELPKEYDVPLYRK